jgi:hypothetical protein
MLNVDIKNNVNIFINNKKKINKIQKNLTLLNNKVDKVYNYDLKNIGNFDILFNYLDNFNNKDIFFDLNPKLEKLESIEYGLSINKNSIKKKDFINLLNSSDMLTTNFNSDIVNKKFSKFVLKVKKKKINKNKLINISLFNSINVD